jgi:hypothetical protein
MRKFAWNAGIVGLFIFLLFAGAVADGKDSKAVTGFGFGGPLVGVFAPDLDEVNEFLEDNGYTSLGDLLIVSGGGGRGGLIGGLSVGGIGWGATTTSLQENRKATLSIGFGGLALGYVVGGNERSLLTFGVVLGGGGVSLDLREVAPEDFWICPGGVLANHSIPSQNLPSGIIIEPTPVNTCWGFIAVEPYLGMQVQPLGWLGFEVRFGYLFTLFGGGCCGGADIPWPSLDLSGPVVELAVTFGGIGSLGWSFPYSETVEDTVALSGRTSVAVENEMGSITIGPEIVVTVQTGATDVLTLIAVKRTRKEDILAAVEIVIEDTDKGLQIRSQAPDQYSGRWSVDFVLHVPVGTSLQIEQGVGDIMLSDCSGAVSIELGVGDVEIEQLIATELLIKLGVGDLTLMDIECKFAQVEVGTGDVDIRLHLEAAYTVMGVVGLGDITIAGFPAMVLDQAGFIRKEAHAILGEGAGQLALVVGVGDITILPLSE